MSTQASIVSPRLISKAAVSSLIATGVDGLAYQLLLFVLPLNYGVVAFVGALLGGFTNFTINRSWTFQAQADDARLQGVRYALVSGATFLVLRGLLWLLVDTMNLSARLAWAPAKVLAFLLVSYPAQRAWVFATRA